jgi:hypothetical protein
LGCAARVAAALRRVHRHGPKAKGARKASQAKPSHKVKVARKVRAVSLGHRAKPLPGMAVVADMAVQAHAAARAMARALAPSPVALGAAVVVAVAVAVVVVRADG